MKVHFVFNHRKYVAPSKKEAKKFLEFYDGWSSRIFRLQTNWKIKHIERAAGWVPIPILDNDMIEFTKEPIAQ